MIIPAYLHNLMLKVRLGHVSSNLTPKETSRQTCSRLGQSSSVEAAFGQILDAWPEWYAGQF